MGGMGVWVGVYLYQCVCVCVRACVRACVCACVCLSLFYFYFLPPPLSRSRSAVEVYLYSTRSLSLEMTHLGLLQQDITALTCPVTIKRSMTEEDLDEEWDFSVYATPMPDFTSTTVPSAANNWGADTTEVRHNPKPSPSQKHFIRP